MDALLTKYRKAFLPAPVSSADVASSSVDSEGAAGTESDGEHGVPVAPTPPPGPSTRDVGGRATSPAGSRATDVESREEEAEESRHTEDGPRQTGRLNGVFAWKLKQYSDAGLPATQSPCRRWGPS